MFNSLNSRNLNISKDFRGRPYSGRAGQYRGGRSNWSCKRILNVSTVTNPSFIACGLANHEEKWKEINTDHWISNSFKGYSIEFDFIHFREKYQFL